MKDRWPAFLFYVRDFWTSESVEQMSAADVGLYLFLLCRQWETGSLPADANAVRRLCVGILGVEHASFEKVLSCFPMCDDGRLRNERLEAERDRLRGKSAGASKSAKIRWHGPKKKGPRASPSDANAMRTQCERNASEWNGREENLTGASHLSAFGNAEPLRDDTSHVEAPHEPAEDAPRERPPNRPPPIEVEAVPDDGSAEPAGAKRKRGGGGGNAMTRHWDAEWARLRPDHGPFPWTKGHAVALARCAKFPGSSPEEVCRRITRLLASQDAFHLRTATPQSLQSAWANLPADIVRPMTERERILATPIPEYPYPPSRP